MTTLVLVSCVGKKKPLARGKKVQAKDLYTSDWFKKARAYAELLVREGYVDGWAILSAKHGLVSPTTRIGTYDETITAPTPIDEARAWARVTAAQIDHAVPPPAPLRLILLAGKRYRLITNYLHPRAVCEVPMQGMGIGDQKKWLKEQVG